MFWIVNFVHAALVVVPKYINEKRKEDAESGSGEVYEKFELDPLDWGVSTMGLALLFFFMCARHMIYPTPPPVHQSHTHIRRKRHCRQQC